MKTKWIPNWFRAASPLIANSSRTFYLGDLGSWRLPFHKNSKKLFTIIFCEGPFENEIVRRMYKGTSGVTLFYWSYLQYTDYFIALIGLGDEQTTKLTEISKRVHYENMSSKIYCKKTTSSLKEVYIDVDIATIEKLFKYLLLFFSFHNSVQINITVWYTAQKKSKLSFLWLNKWLHLKYWVNQWIIKQKTTHTQNLERKKYWYRNFRFRGFTLFGTYPHMWKYFMYYF